MLGFGNTLRNKTPRPLRFPLILWSIGRLWLYLLRYRPAAVHFFLPASYCLGAPVALLAGARPLLMSRRSRNHYLDGRPFFRWLERLLHSRMMLLLGNSKRVIADLIDEGAAPDRIRLIYNGVKLPSSEGREQQRISTRAELGLDDEFIIVCVANLIPYKGHADLLDALAQRRDMLPPWRLLLVGRDDGIGAELRAQAQQAGIEKNVVLLGPRSDVAALLTASDLSVLASHEEGFSNAVLEAMAAGLPVVATDVGGNAEAVVNGETGFIVPSHDPDALGEALEKCVMSRELCRKLGLAGAERARTRFSLERCVAEYEELYRSLAK